MARGTTKNDVKYVNTMEAVKAIFGNREFTRAEYNKIAKSYGLAGLDTLVSYGVKVVRKETFTVKLKDGRFDYQYVLKTDDGTIVPNLSADDYRFANTRIRKVLDNILNNGNPLTVEFGEVNEVEGVRYFYAVDNAAYDNRLNKLRKRNHDTLNRLNVQIVKLQNRKAFCENFADLLD